MKPAKTAPVKNQAGSSRCDGRWLVQGWNDFHLIHSCRKEVALLHEAQVGAARQP